MNSARVSAFAAIAALGAVAALGCAGAHPAPEAPIVDSLDIEGAKKIPAGDIQAKIVTSGTSWLPFSEKHYYDEGVLETDLKRILRLYQANGYYKARIAERRVKPAGDNAVDITIRIDEGPPTLVTELALEGLDAVPETERARLLRGMPLRAGDVLTEAGYDAYRNLLADRLHQNGFAEAEVDGVVQVHLAEDGASVVFNASTGERYRYGEVFVAGANQVPRRRIHEIVRDVLPLGKVYNEAALSEAEGRLFDLGVFSAAKVSRGAPDRRAGTVPIVVSVREAPFRTVRLGAGVGFDPNLVELPRLTADLTNRNFFGGLRRLVFTNQASLVLLSFPGGFTKSSDRGFALSSALEFQQPSIFRRDLTLTSSIGYQHGVELAYRFDSLTGSLGLLWRISRSVTVTPSYNLSLFALNTPESLLAALNSGLQGAVLDECAKTRSLCRLAYLEERISWDRRDNPVESTRGGLLALSFQEGSRGLGGSYDYLRVLPEARVFFPFGPHVLAVRGMAGLLIPSAATNSSVLTRFYLGGSNSQRGFGNRVLAPSIAVLNGTTVDVLPVGGNGMLDGSVEFRIALPANFGLVPFVDAGMVTERASELLNKGLHIAAGLGLRYRTVFGPVRLDVGYRVNKKAPDLPVEGSAGLDVPAIPVYAIHFSIGEAY